MRSSRGNLESDDNLAKDSYLELLLSKPLGRTQYLFARALPVFGVIAGMGIILSLFLPLKIAIINGSADLHLAGVITLLAQVENFEICVARLQAQSARAVSP